jgi:hypothetical protein
MLGLSEACVHELDITSLILHLATPSDRLLIMRMTRILHFYVVLHKSASSPHARRFHV